MLRDLKISGVVFIPAADFASCKMHSGCSGSIRSYSWLLKLKCCTDRNDCNRSVLWLLPAPGGQQQWGRPASSRGSKTADNLWVKVTHGPCSHRHQLHCPDPKPLNKTVSCLNFGSDGWSRSWWGWWICGSGSLIHSSKWSEGGWTA